MNAKYIIVIVLVTLVTLSIIGVPVAAWKYLDCNYGYMDPFEKCWAEYNRVLGRWVCMGGKQGNLFCSGGQHSRRFPCTVTKATCCVATNPDCDVTAFVTCPCSVSLDYCKYDISTSDGGVSIPINKFKLLDPFIDLTSTILVATVATAIYVKSVKHRKEKQ